MPNRANAEPRECHTARMPHSANAIHRECHTARPAKGRAKIGQRRRMGKMIRVPIWLRLIRNRAIAWRMSHRDLDVLDAAERAADGVNRLIDRSPRRLLHIGQMPDSAQSIGANISEGFGRGRGRDRARSLEIARGEAEETIRHLAANFRIDRIAPRDYWPLHNLLVVIVKMLNSLIHR